ncbi:MAG: hypothetical protein IJX92_00530 [Clostridia bacterium]|nr:hypothetical protein [Clostridia bacterium]
MENKNLDEQMKNNPETENKEIHSVEFEIGKPKEEDNLIFEVSREGTEIKKNQKQDEPVEDLVIGKRPGQSADEPKADAGVQTPSATRRSVYVPRFTEASEKYRKIIDPRTKAQSKERVSAKIEATTPSNIRVETFRKVDPTAELEEIAENQVVVNVTNPEPPLEAINVFKFRQPEAPVFEEPEILFDEEEAVAEEREQIEALITPTPDPEEEITEQPAVTEETIEEEEILTEEEKVELPDPGEEVYIEELMSNSSDDKDALDAPDCLSADEPKDAKKKSSEFTHQSQRDSFKDRFLDSLMALKIRMGAVGVFSALILLFEMLVFSGEITSNVFPASAFFGTAAIVDLLAVACVCILTLPETVKALKNLAEGKVVAEIFLPISFVVISAYLIVLIAVPTLSYALFGFIFAVIALVSVFASYYRLNADFIAFKVISQNTEKKILDKKMTRDLPKENLALDGLVDEYRSKTSRIFRVAFITDFFARTSEPAVKRQHVLSMLAISAIAALISAVICFFVPGGIVSAAAAFALVFLLGCPTFAILSHKISYFDSQNAALIEDSTVVGEKSYFDFSEVDVIAFEDTEIFGTEDVNLKRFMLYGERDNIEKAMRQMYSLFTVVGGPLYKIFANALDNRVRHAPAENPEIEEDGISGNLSGHRIYAGTEEYMRRHGIALPQSSGSDVSVDTTKVMYAAEDGEVYAKFYIRYSFTEEFTMLLPELKKEGIVPLIYTSDPNLSNELLKTLSAGADCMRVVKRLEPKPDTAKIYRRASASVVTYGDKINAINTILLTRKYKSFSDKLAIAELYSMSIGAAVAAVASLLCATAIPSLAFGLWHVLSCVVLRFVSKRVFLGEKK